MIELHFARLQTALFLTSLDIAKKLDLAVTIRDSSQGLFDADFVVLPIPPDAPLNFPRLQLKSGDGYWTCQVTGNRLDFVFEVPPDQVGDENFQNIIQAQAHTCAAVWDAIQEHHSASGNRIGIVSLFFSFLDDPLNIVRTRFMQPSDAPDPHQLHLMALHKIVMGDIPVNRWTRCLAGSLSVGENTRDALRLEIDINTFSEEEFVLNPDHILRFADLVRELVPSTTTSLFGDNPERERVF